MERFARGISKAMALLGGLVLLCLIAITCFSVAGRVLNTIGHYSFVKENVAWLSTFLIRFGPIVGDFELVEAGVAFAIMAFLPWCQLNRKHAKVELFTGFLPGTANRFLAAMWETLFAFVMAIITWRLYAGTIDKLQFNETTFMLQFPVWWGYAACTFAAAIATLVAIYSAWKHLQDIGQPPNSIDVAREEIAR